MRVFPIIWNQSRWPNGYKPLSSVPWEFAAPHALQMEVNHQQTMQRLAERGGLSAEEMLRAIWKMRLFVEGSMTPQHADEQLRVYVSGWEKTNPPSQETQR